MIKYEIRKGSHAPCELISIVEKENYFGAMMKYENFVTEGTHNECERVKHTLENGGAK